jgi:hypothetical protein
MFADARIAQLIQREQEQAQAAAKLASANLNQRLAHAQSIASTLALDPTVQFALGRFGPNARASTLPVTERGDMWRGDPMLTLHRHAHGANGGQVRSQHPLGHQRGWRRFMKRHATGDSLFTGTNYANRTYFNAAQQGICGRQFAIG